MTTHVESKKSKQNRKKEEKNSQISENYRGTLTVGASCYKGTFEDGQFIDGEYQAPDGTVFTGDFACFNLINGHGMAKYVDGSIFIGNWKLGQKDGPDGRME